MAYFVVAFEPDVEDSHNFPQLSVHDAPAELTEAISPISPLYLPYISLISPLYLAPAVTVILTLTLALALALALTRRCPSGTTRWVG